VRRNEWAEMIFWACVRAFDGEWIDIG